MADFDLKLYDIPNSTFRLDGGAMFGVVPKAMWEREYPADDANRILLTTRMILIRDEANGRNIVTDPGIGGREIWDEKFAFRFSLEQPAHSLEESLGQLGLAPDDISDVFLTHLHFDHLAGCFTRQSNDELTLRFANARHHVQRGQWDYAHAPSAKDNGSYTLDHLDLLEKSGALTLGEGEFPLIPGVDVFPVEGHTFAQQLLRVQTSEQTWVYGGDLFPFEVFLRAPWIMAYDLEPLKTLEAKQHVLDKHLFAGEHLILAHDPRTIGGGPVDRSQRYPQLTKKLTARNQITPLGR